MMPTHTHTPIKHIQVFVASPGGLAAERQAVRDVAEECNLSLSKHGWHVDVLGWEDRGPTSGRPQEDINRDVRSCDIFVGIVGSRWGTPTGAHSSGFAEEWELALDRNQRTGSPELWLYLKKLPDSPQDDDPQLLNVVRFRREVEESEIAFHKSFDDTADFVKLLRSRLLTAVLDRSGLTRTEVGEMALDWTAAYPHDPVWSIPQLRDQQVAARQLLDTHPLDAASALERLANDVDQHGFTTQADTIRINAAHAYLTGGQLDTAITLCRRVLAGHLWWMRTAELERLLPDLTSKLPPEFATEARGWRACWQSIEDPAFAIEELTIALSATHSIPLDATTITHWNIVLWRCHLHLENPEAVLSVEGEIDLSTDETQLELAMLRAEALRAAGHLEADAAWAQLRKFAINHATSHPAKAASIATRIALDLVYQEDFVNAETAYIGAATRWSNVKGGHEQGALAFFSAQATVYLRGEWSVRGWEWRSVAAAQRSATMSFARRAEQLERQALHQRLAGKHDSAIPLLTATLWCYQRAGLLHGILNALALLGDAYTDAGNHEAAVILYCRSRNSERAEIVAQKSTDRSSLVAKLAGRWPHRSLGARYAAIAIAGRSAAPEVAASLAADALDTLTGVESSHGNTERAAADALAELGVAVDDKLIQERTVSMLQELAVHGSYPLANAGRHGLRMLCDIGRLNRVDQLITHFATDARSGEPDAVWVSQHLTTQPQIAMVRRAALNGHRHALLALIHADLVASDEALLDYCRGATVATLSSDLGMTDDGKSMHGLMALSAVGSIAAATRDPGLQRNTAETLLLYASESHWPMVNRVSAAAGLWPLLKVSDDQQWFERLRPLVAPIHELEEDSESGTGLWAERGDLEAMALRVTASLAGRLPTPAWLDIAAVEATYDERESIRVASWFAAGEHAEWFSEHRARFALIDPSEAVRTEAIRAWQFSASAGLPHGALRRLVTDPAVGVRLALVHLLKRHPDPAATDALRRDSDAYVRGIAARELP